MATTKAKLGIDIDVQSAKAGKKVQKLGKDGKKAFNAMEKASKQFSLAFKGAIALFAGQKVLGAFKSVTAAAIQQENAINALNTQLKLAGDFSEESSKDMQDFAKYFIRDADWWSRLGFETDANPVARADGQGVHQGRQGSG